MFLFSFLFLVFFLGRNAFAAETKAIYFSNHDAYSEVFGFLGMGDVFCRVSVSVLKLFVPASGIEPSVNDASAPVGFAGLVDAMSTYTL